MRVPQSPFTSHGRPLFRVRFLDREDKAPQEVVVNHCGPSDYFGLVALEGFVFHDAGPGGLIRPDEEASRRRWGKTRKLHIPYHNLVSVEEFSDAEADVHAFPRVRSVPQPPIEQESHD